jgi:hypothetical protein
MSLFHNKLSLSLTQECGLTVFEKKVLRRTSGPERNNRRIGKAA